jgi:hypothetical protein
VRELQFHRTPEEPSGGGAELSAGEELESRAEGAVVDEDADELLHYGFGVFHELGEPAPHLVQGR